MTSDRSPLSFDIMLMSAGNCTACSPRSIAWPTTSFRMAVAGCHVRERLVRGRSDLGYFTTATLDDGGMSIRRASGAFVNLLPIRRPLRTVTALRFFNCSVRGVGPGPLPGESSRA